MRNAQGEAQSSVQRLASGSAFVRAGDDVASMAIATDLQRNVTGLKASLNNALQAQSYLSIADAALGKIEEVLQRMSAVSVQASSGALLDKERGFLNLEFQNLKDEINRLAENTSFSGTNVLQRVGEVTLGFSIDESPATQATGSITLLSTSAAVNTIAINGVSLEVPAGGSVENMAESLVTILNDTEMLENTLLGRLGAPPHSALDREQVVENVARIQEATYVADGDTIRITHRSTGDLSNNFTVTTPATNFQLGGASEVGANRYTLSGGSDGGSNAGNVTVSGGASPSGVLTEQTAAPSEAIYRLDPAVNVSDGARFGIDSSGVFIVFTFRDTPSASPLEVQRGATAEESMRNLTTALNNYDDVVSNDNYAFEQLDFIRDGADLIIRSKQNDNPLQVGVNTNTSVIGFGEDSAGTIVNPDSMSGAILLKDLDDGSLGGFNADGISNEAFIGSVDADFDVDIMGSNHVSASVTIGEHTYTAVIMDTNTDINRIVQFNSNTGGGFFQMELAANSGFNVSNDEDSARYEDALQTVIASRTFYQEQGLVLDNPGDLIGTNISLVVDDNDAIRFDSIDVRSSSETVSGNAEIRFTINGEDYVSSQAIGSNISEDDIIEFRNVRDANKVLTIATDGRSYDLTDHSNAAAFKLSLKEGLLSDEGNSNVPQTETYQVAVDPYMENDFSIHINYISIETLFENASGVNVQTVEGAEGAAAQIKEAIYILTSERVNVGAGQARLEYAINQTNTAIINQDSARAALSDTDVVSESTRFALEQVKLNAGISLLAQTNALKRTLISSLYR